MKMLKKTLVLVLSVFFVVTIILPIGVSAKVKAPAKPSSLSFSSTSSAITLKWKKVSGADGYTVYLYNTEAKKYSAQKTVSKNTYTSPKLKSGTTYIYAVKSYKKSNKSKVYSAYSSKKYTTTRPSKVTGFKVLGRNVSSVKLSWNKVKRANGYKIMYSTDKSLKSGVKSKIVTACNTKVSSLKNKTYYFRVYAYKKLSDEKYYSAASSSIKSESINSSTLSTVNTSKKYQTIEGFGASGAWWSQKVGGWENAEKIIKYLYDKKEGIGLNIYRYNVGAGSKDDSVLINDWTRTEGFINSVDFINNKITYDFSRDSEAQDSLRIAKKLAGNNLKVVLFSNSPPIQLTKNGKAYCSYSDDLHNGISISNLDEKNYPLFAQYECDVADYFVSQGYNVSEISPVNEPQLSWSETKDDDGKFSMEQEGSYYSPDELKLLYKEMLIKSKGKSYGVSMFESATAEGLTSEGKNSDFVKYFNEIYSDTTNKKNLKNVSVHSNWADAKSKKACRKYVDSVNPSINISCTKYSQLISDTSSGISTLSNNNLTAEERKGYSIDFGVQLARVINEDLTILNATQWNWWTACSDGRHPDGLVYINDSNHNDIKLTKRLWCLGNYSKFIKRGARRVKITEKQKNLISSAFINPDGSLVIVYVNQTKNKMSVNIDTEGYSNYKVYETSENKNLGLTKQGGFYSTKAILLPAQSVVSVILTK